VRHCDNRRYDQVSPFASQSGIFALKPTWAIRARCILQANWTKIGSWAELIFHPYNCEEMLGARSRNVAACSLLITIRCQHLYDYDRICLEPFEARPGDDENAFVLTPGVELLSKRYGLEVCGPIAFGVTRLKANNTSR
jgi:hypothetical protein